MSETAPEAGLLTEVAFQNTVGVLVVDDGGMILSANQPIATELSYAAEQLSGRQLAEIYQSEGERTLDAIREATTNQVRSGRIQATLLDATGRDIPTEARVSATEHDGALYYVLTFPEDLTTDRTDVPTSRQQSEAPNHSVAALSTATQQIAVADSRDATVAATVDALSGILGQDIGCVWLLDEDEQALERCEATDDAAALVDDNPTFELDVSGAGRAYRTNEPVVKEPASESERSDLLTSSVHLPLGEHGVLTVATTEERSISSDEVTQLRTLATNVKLAFDRFETAGAPRHSRDDAETDTERSAETVLEKLVDKLTDATGSDDLQRSVCAELAAPEAYDGAAILEVDVTGDCLRVSHDRGFPENHVATLDKTPLSGRDTEVLSVVAETADPHVCQYQQLVPEANERKPDREDGTEPTDPGIGAVAILPLTNGDRLYGLLCVRATERAAFERGGLEELSVVANVTSFALSAFENEDLLLSDESVQLTFQVTDPDCLTVALSSALDTYCSMRRTIKNGAGEHLSYVRVEGRTATEVRDALAEIDGVHDHRVISDQEGECVVEVTRPASGAEVMIEYGATMHTAEADSGRGTLVIEAPRSADVRELVQAYQSYNPGSELITKREVDREVRTADEFRETIENQLTEKQRSAISSAYYSGYYEWPRESTAEEIAESMDVTASTLHQHLRRAHEKLLTAFLEKPDSSVDTE